MNNLETNAAALLGLTTEEERDDFQLQVYEQMRANLEQQRDILQMRMDACDSLILEIQKKRVGK